MSRTTKRTFLLVAAVGAVLAARGGPASASTEVTCSSLSMVWHDPETGAVIRSEPYVCGADLCGGYRCKEGNEISPACYGEAECPVACGGECVHVPTAQLDCATMCNGAGCGIQMTWYKRRTLLRSEPYDCTADACTGFRCLDGSEISPACYTAAQCAKSCKSGTCVDVPALQQGDCNAALCSDY
ncbi:MAG: hypothetical protein AB1689_27290 [Thermodesulfobacteriota bacterium]